MAFTLKLSLLAALSAAGDSASPFSSLGDSRPYAPVVISGSILSDFYGVPVEEIVIYAYDAAEQNWTRIPFQIDERVYCEDPLNPGHDRWFYFPPETCEGDTTLGRLGDHDELVFMIRDLGDKAPYRAWIEDAEARTHPRIELFASDPENPEEKGVVYVYRSSTITEEMPRPYGFEYFPETDSLVTGVYAVDLGPFGVIEDIVINEPGGSGIDVFDTQKLRFGGIIDLGLFPIDLRMTEQYLYLYEGILTTPDPVVRLIRRATQTIRIGAFISHNTPFYITTKFYPYSGSIETGASIASEDLRNLYPNADISIIIKTMRHSWDFNENAAGMLFYNRYNQDVIIDGSPDDPDRTIDIPVDEWSLITGDHGSVFTYFKLEETAWDRIELYYHDNQAGGQYDSQEFSSQDTGDGISFGDHGILFQSGGRDSLNLDLDLTAYFLPESNLTKAAGERLARQLMFPVQLYSSVTAGIESDPLQPGRFRLEQNHPNPFNASTQIAFSLPYGQDIRLEIRDVRGRLIRTLLEGETPPGMHRVVWTGQDTEGRRVPSGIYVVTLSSRTQRQTRKLILIQ